jgi:hypothetical protein
MNFQAYLVKQNSSPLLNVTLIGALVFFLSIYLWAFEVDETISLLASVTGILLALIGALLNRGKGLFEVSEEVLFINEKNIIAGSSVYPISAITNLRFYYDSFYGQSPFGYFIEHAGAILYGMNNRVTFMVDQQELQFLFYLSEKMQADNFFSFLAVLKEKRVLYSFRRRDYYN